MEIGGTAVHLHLTLWGPAWTPLYDGIDVQDWPGGNPGFIAFLGLHAEAVKFCDDLLDRLGDAEAARTRARERWEQETRFESHVDRRLWFLSRRLEQGSHPFTPAQALDYRVLVSKFMQAVPRLTAPVVERR